MLLLIDTRQIRKVKSCINNFNLRLFICYRWWQLL